MKTTPMEHQSAALAKSFRKRNFAYLMEQGTGKTWTTLADTERMRMAKLIESLLIIAPKGVHTNWVRREMPTHLEIPVRSYIWKGKPTSKKAIAELEAFFAPWKLAGEEPMRVLAMNIDAVNTDAGYDLAERFLEASKCLMVVDESTRIKNHSAKRTKKVQKLGKLATARRILTGTPLTKAPTDLFSQFEFLQPGCLGTKSFAAFNAEYSVLAGMNDPEMIAIMRKMAGKIHGLPQVVKRDANGRPMYRNLDQLAKMIEPLSFRVRKEDCLDLPDKIYKAVTFQLSSQQRSVYDRLYEENEFHLIKDDGMSENMSFQSIAARTKMKQVTSGFINIYGEPQLMSADDNPRMKAFIEIVEMIEDNGEDPQFIVWAMFREEMNQIMAQLELMGIVAKAYHGGTPANEREEIIDGFQRGDIQAFVGHAAAAGIGLTLTAAHDAIYYSCSYDNELRKQSEDRCHRIGTKKNVRYWDIIGEDTLDEDIIDSLAAKTEIADTVIDRK